MIVFNKAVLSSFDFPYPMFLTSWHMLFGTVITQILSKYTSLLPGVKEDKVSMDVFLKQIIPVALCFSVSLVAGNTAYIYLSVSYIQMLKAFTPVAVLVLSSIVGLSDASITEYNIVAIISMGVALTSMGELQFSMVGFTYQSIAIIAEATRLALTSVLLKQLKLDSLSTLYYVAPVCGCCIGTFCFFMELPTMPWTLIARPSFWMVLIANGLVAFSLNICSVMLIKHTSALTLTLAGIVKDILLVALSLIVFQSPVTMLQYLGYAVSLLALNLHKDYKSNKAAFGITQADPVVPVETHPQNNSVPLTNPSNTVKEPSNV